jgi:selenocysteine lyase/cysteine desulfurase
MTSMSRSIYNNTQVVSVNVTPQAIESRLAHAKREFTLNPDTVYLNHASISIMNDNIQSKLHESIYWRSMYGSVPEFNEATTRRIPGLARLEVMSLINAKSPNEIAFVQGTTHGLYAVASSIDWKEGDNIVCNDMEFNSNFFMYQQLAERFELQVRIVQSDNGELNICDFENCINHNTRLVAISLVQYETGYRVPIESISDIAHKIGYHGEGAIVLVDGAQAAGIVPIDVQNMGIDALSTCGYKWLMGPMNCGFLYVKEDIAENLNPSFVGWMSDEKSPSMTHRHFYPARGALRFETTPLSELNVLRCSIEYLRSHVGIPIIHNHVRNVTNYLMTEIELKEWNLRSKTFYSTRSGIVNFSVPQLDDETIVKYLRKNNIIVGYRNGIRVSVHFINTIEDIDKLINAIEEF